MNVTFLPHNVKIEISSYDSILTGAIKAGLYMESNCGGRGSCGKCKIRLLSGEVSDVTKEEISALSKEERSKGYRLACRLFAKSDIVVQMQEDRKEVTRKSINSVLPEGFFIKPRKLATVILEKRVKESNEESIGPYGVAFDVGTTSVVGMLWNLKTGEYIDSIAKANPQRAYGADVISRIQYSLKDESNVKELQEQVIHCCQGIIEELIQKSSLTEEAIVQLVMVGNTTMSHLFLGLLPKHLARIPFTPEFDGEVKLPASKLGFHINSEGQVLVAANLAGHVGSDITAGILATQLYKKEGLYLMIDIGTNGEIVLHYNNNLYICSTAAGPAFEGSSIQWGMRASEGAIEGIAIELGKVKLKVIGDTKPKGICGSGLIDGIAQLLKAGIMDETGRILDKSQLKEKGIEQSLIDLVYPTERGNDFILFSDEKEEIRITQKDIREVQLAKGAIHGGIKTMLMKVEKTEKDIDQFLLAGAFGNYIKKESAVTIGLIPDIAIDKIVAVGNIAGIGASMILLSEDTNQIIEEFSHRITHIELANDEDFMEVYIDSMNFPSVGTDSND